MYFMSISESKKSSSVNWMALCLAIKSYLGLRLLFLKCLLFPSKQALLLETKEYTQHANNTYHPIGRGYRGGGLHDGCGR